jgi:hypothetical protein
VLLGEGAAAAQPPLSSPLDAEYAGTGPISGYMDFHFNKPEGQDGEIDFHRFVLLVSHSFSSRHATWSRSFATRTSTHSTACRPAFCR